MPDTESLLDGLANSAKSTVDADISDITAPTEHIFTHSAKGPLKDGDDESEEEFKEKLTDWFMQMMFVSGETAEPSAETTGMIEELVRQQVIEMVSHSAVPLPEAARSFIYERSTFS
jgi:Transcription initiation factor IID, 18kD subunit